MAGKFNGTFLMVTRRNFIKTGLIFVPTAYAQVATVPNRRKAFSSACSGYPCTVPNLTNWWKADSLVLNDGDPASSWTDIVGGNIATATGTARPTFKTNIMGSGSVVRFNGTSNWMNFTPISLLRSSGATVFAVCSYNPAGSVSGYAFTLGYLLWCSATILIYVDAYPAGGKSTAVVTTAKKMLAIKWGTTADVRVNTGQAGGTFPATTVVDHSLQSFSADTNFASCDIAEVIVYNRSLSDAECDGMYNNYLQAKYSL